MLVWDIVSKYTFDSPENQIKLLLEKARPLLKKKSLAILDAGGGLENRGILLDQLGKRTVIDIQPGPNVDVVGDIHDLPFPDKSFDLITLFMVLEHLHDPQLAIKECQRVLKKNGVLLGTTVQYWHTHAHPNDYFRYTQFGLKHIFEQAHLPLQSIWSSGGPFLVLYHVIELNLPSFLRKFFLLTCVIFNYLDLLAFKHQDQRKYSDSVGWSFIAKKA
jgi:SAM-dependent methyltransferase